MTEDKCPECGSKELILTKQLGELICKTCGLVIDDALIESESFSKTTGRGELQLPSLATAGTHIQTKGFKSGMLYSTREKNLNAGMSKIALIASRLRLPEFVTREAKSILKNVIERDLTIGRDTTTMAYASVYVACHLTGVPKTPFEVVAFTSITKKKLLRSVKVLKKRIKLELKPIDPVDLVPRFASKLLLSDKTITRAVEMIEELDKLGYLIGKFPETIAATAIYMSSKEMGESRTQREISNVTGIIEITIRKRKKEILDLLGEREPKTAMIENTPLSQALPE